MVTNYVQHKLALLPPQTPCRVGRFKRPLPATPLSDAAATNQRKRKWQWKWKWRQRMKQSRKGVKRVERQE